jgi:hypothetical protein
MTEAAKNLSGEELAARVAGNVRAGRWHCEAEDVEAAQAAGLPVKPIRELYERGRVEEAAREAEEWLRSAMEQTVNKSEAFVRRPLKRDEPKAEPLPANKSLVAAEPKLPPPPPRTWDEVIEAMNERHAIIENVGGKTTIASWEPSTVDPTRLEVVFHTKESFLLRYLNRKVALEVPGGRSVNVKLGDWWLNHPDRRQFRGVTFAPAALPVVNDCLNTWQGWGVEAKPGDWGLIRGTSMRWSQAATSSSQSTS